MIDQSQEFVCTQTVYILQMVKKQMQRQIEDGLSICHPVHSSDFFLLCHLLTFSSGIIVLYFETVLTK